jgi:ABC-type transport system involved in cytochrome bd biosynthesis fused ATPase/permease subunit
LDPFDEYDDATLNAALKSSGLYAFQDDSEESRLNLDATIASGGTNVSAGQRQIIALARAIVRSTKLLILDEGSHPFEAWTLIVLIRPLSAATSAIGWCSVHLRLGPF